MANSVQYGTGQGGLTNQQLAQLLYQQQTLAGPNQGGDYDPLGDALNQQQNHPVYSIGQGGAAVAGKLGSAYLQKKNYQKLLALAGQNAEAFKGAANTAQDTSLAKMDNGQLANISGGRANLISQQPSGPVPNSSLLSGEPLKYANVSLPQDMVNSTPLTPNERIAHALAPLSGMQVQQYGDKIAQLARESQPPPATLAKFQSGETGVLLDPLTNKPLPNQPGAQNSGDTLSGGPAQTETAKDLILAGYKPGTPAFQKAMQARLQKDMPISWSTMTPAQKAANGMPAAQNAQISTTGEVRPMPKEPGQIGPAYDSFTGQPMGVVDYTSPETAAKLKTGELLPHEPHPLQGADVEKLTKIGNQTQELQQQLEKFKPEYSRIVGADSAIRGMIGGKAFNEGAEWVNQTKNILLQNTRDVAGRSPQLIKEYNSLRPEATDAPDVIVRKMQNLIELKRQEGANQANTYIRGGHLGSQVVQAIGFDPRATAIPNTPSPVGAPVVANPYVDKYGLTPKGGP